MPIMPAFVHVSVQNHACAYASAYDDVIVSVFCGQALFSLGGGVLGVALFGFFGWLPPFRK